MADAGAAELEAFLAGLDYSKRSVKIDYDEIRRVAKELLGSKMAMGWGISLNLESLAKKDGRYIQSGETRMTYEELLDALGTQDSDALTNGRNDPSVRINTSKSTVTIARLARAYAKLTIIYLQKFPEANTFAGFRTKVTEEELPQQFMFLNAPYGMDKATVLQYKAGFIKFYTAFDVKIAEGVAKGWQRNEKGEVIASTEKSRKERRSWVQAFQEYCEFEAIA